MLSQSKSLQSSTQGPFSIVDDLAQRLWRRWVPKWYHAFSQGSTGLFYERLGHAFRPVLTGRRRALSQLRQLAMYAHAHNSGQMFMFAPALQTHFEAICSAYADPAKEGAWFFALDEACENVSDTTHDLYAHAFVIFAFSHYARATGDARARTHALATLNFIDTAFRAGASIGLAEALDKTGAPLTGLPRRHESHMHLLEGCLFAYETWGDKPFLDMATELVTLFFDKFYNTDTNILVEYYDADLNPTADMAAAVPICEPGHYYEWIWLLKKHASLINEPKKYDTTCLRLLDWANTHGWDATHGGIYDELGTDGRVVTPTKRLWPFTEGLKANALMLDCVDVEGRDAAKAHMANMCHVFRTRYIDKRGFWVEWLERDLTKAADYMPATSPYHVYFGVVESLRVLQSRGNSKSWRAGPKRVIYMLRRMSSALARHVRVRFLRG